jgi:hypothetical protein
MRTLTRRTHLRRNQGIQGKNRKENRTNVVESEEDRTKYCHAGNLFRGDSSTLVLEGLKEDDETSGVLCSKCTCTFHIVHLYVFEGKPYCLKCYKNDVVSQCSPEKLFSDVMGEESLMLGGKQEPKYTIKDMSDFVDNNLSDVSLT